MGGLCQHKFWHNRVTICLIWHNFGIIGRGVSRNFLKGGQKVELIKKGGGGNKNYSDTIMY